MPIVIRSRGIDRIFIHKVHVNLGTAGDLNVRMLLEGVHNGTDPSRRIVIIVIHDNDYIPLTHGGKLVKLMTGGMLHWIMDISSHRNGRTECLIDHLFVRF
jgi:hypothetical protein